MRRYKTIPFCRRVERRNRKEMQMLLQVRRERTDAFKAFMFFILFAASSGH